MEKKDKRTPEEIARDLEDVVLPEISESDLEDAFGGISEQEVSVTIRGC